MSNRVRSTDGKKEPSVTAREEILQRLQERARQAVAPAPWRSRRNFADLADQFATALTTAGGEVIRSTGTVAALEVLGDLLRQLDAAQVVADGVPPLVDSNLDERWPRIRWHLVGHSGGNLRPFAAAADVGLSVALVALAETGTVVVGSGPATSRLTGLLPPVHVALVPSQRLTSDLFTWTAKRQGGWPAALTLISGPSKTADIEQTMAVGVHGPKRFIAILYE